MGSSQVRNECPRPDELCSHLRGKSAKVQARGTRRKSSACVWAQQGDAMSRKRTRTIETYSDSAITWFFVGLMLIAAIAAVLGEMGIS
jgi:hypothetical protein